MQTTRLIIQPAFVPNRFNVVEVVFNEQTEEIGEVLTVFYADLSFDDAFNTVVDLIKGE
jgi:DNA-directed RNA polymerase delta subunit